MKQEQRRDILDVLDASHLILMTKNSTTELCHQVLNSETEIFQIRKKLCAAEAKFGLVELG